MKKLTRIFILTLALIQIVLCFSSCKFSWIANIFGNEGDESAQESTMPDGEDSADGQETYVLTKEALSSYSIIIPAQSSEDIRAVAKVLQRSVKDATGLELKIKDDITIEGNDEFSESEYEILIGDTNRQVCRSIYKDIKINDYGYTMVGKKILILGYTNASANNAVIEFKLDILKDAKNKDVLMDSDDCKLVKGNYEKETLYINGVDIAEYTIVYPNACVKGENEIAYYLQEYITQKTGHVIRCENDTADVAEYEIQIGDTSRITDAMKTERDDLGYTRKHAYIGKTDNGISLFGNGKAGFYTAFRKLLSRIEDNNEALSLELDASVCEKVEALEVSAMSYNVYFDLSTDKRDPQDVIQTVIDKSPDVFGLNESGKDWVELFLADSEIAAAYECVWGKASENTSDAAYNAIFYRKDKYEEVESGTKWLSSSPDRVSQYPDAKHYKIMTYAILKDKTSGTEFMYLNIHLDGSNDSSSQAALDEVRAKQAEVIKSFIDKYSYLPVIIGGDFNEAPSSSVIKGMSINTRLKYCMNVASQKVDLGTTKKVSSSFAPLEKGSVLDYIFVTGESVSVKLYEQVDNSYRDADGNVTGCPSDHLPVYAELSISY